MQMENKHNENTTQTRTNGLTKCKNKNTKQHKAKLKKCNNKRNKCKQTQNEKNKVQMIFFFMK